MDSDGTSAAQPLDVKAPGLFQQGSPPLSSSLRQGREAAIEVLPEQVEQQTLEFILTGCAKKGSASGTTRMTRSGLESTVRTTKRGRVLLSLPFLTPTVQLRY